MDDKQSQCHPPSMVYDLLSNVFTPPMTPLDATLPIYTVGGTVQPDEGVYIARKADDDLLAACASGDYAYVLTARQLGKSSLMVRTAQRLEQDNVRSVIIDLNELGVQTTVQEWYLGLMFRISSRLRLKINLLQWWREHEDVGVTQRLSLFFQDVVLANSDDRVVVFIDEIDTTLSLDFTDDFFAAIRFLFNARSTNDALKRLSFVLIGVATPSDLIDDAKRTPFNIGRRIDLTDFTRPEAQPFAAGLPGSPSEQTKVLDKIIEWTGGHPYLTQRLCAEMVRQSDGIAPNVDGVVSNIFLGENAYKDNNLQFVRDMLTKRAPAGHERDILTTYQQIRLGRSRVRDEEQSLVKSHLKLAGVVRRDGGDLKLRNKIYKRAFDRRWIRAQWPVSWWELVPFEVKVATFVSGLLLIGLVIATIFAFQQRRVAVDSAETLAAQVVLRTTAEADAVQQAQLAQANASLAEQQADIAASNADEALANFELAATREAEALANAELAQTNEQLAQVNADLAARRALEAETQSKLAQSRALANEAQLIGQENQQLMLLLALESAEFADTNEARLAIQTALALPNRYELRHTLKVGPRSNPTLLGQFSPDDQHMLFLDGNNGQVVLWDLASGEELQRFSHDLFVSSAEFNSDGTQVLTSAVDGVRVWDVATGNLLQAANIGPIFHTTWNDDESLIAAAHFADDAVLLLNAQSLETVATLSINEPVYSSVFSSTDDGRLLVLAEQAAHVFNLVGEKLFVVDPEGTIQAPFIWTATWNSTQDLILTNHQNLVDGFGLPAIWDGNTGEFITELAIPFNRLTGFIEDRPQFVQQVAWSAGGDLVIAAGLDNQTVVWDALSGEIIEEHPMPLVDEFIVRQSAESTSTQLEGQLLSFQRNATIENGVPSGRGTLYFHDLARGDQLGRIDLPGAATTAIWSSDQQWLVTFDDQEQALVWELKPDDGLTYFSGAFPSSSVLFDDQGSKVAIEDSVGFLRIFDSTSSEPIVELFAPTGVVSSDFNDAGTRILYSSSEGKVWIYDFEQETVTTEFEVGSDLLFTAWNYSEDQIVTTSSDKVIRLWDAATGLLLQSFDTPALLALWNRDETSLLAGGFDSTVRLFDLTRDGQPRAILETAEPTGFAIWLLNGERFVAVSNTSFDLFNEFRNEPNYGQLFGEPSTLTFWDIDNLAKPAQTVVFDGVVSALPTLDQSLLLVHVWVDAVEAGAPPAVYVLDAANGEIIFEGRHPGGIDSVIWHTDKQRFATAGRDGKVRIWSLDSADPIAIISINETNITNIDWAYTSEDLLFGTADGRGLRQFAQLSDLTAFGCATAYRNLTVDEWIQFFGDAPYDATCSQLSADPSFIDSVSISAENAAMVASYFADERLRLEGQYSAETHNQICWWGSLWEQASGVAFACDFAVTTATSDAQRANAQDSRAVNRALLGNYSGAAADLVAALGSLNAQRRNLSADYKTLSDDAQKSAEGSTLADEITRLSRWIEQREEWLAALESGSNPISEVVLAQLRAE